MLLGTEDFFSTAVVCQLGGIMMLMRETGGKKSRSPLEILNFPSFLLRLFFFVRLIVLLLRISPLPQNLGLALRNDLV